MKQILYRVLLLLAITATIIGLSACTLFIETEEYIYKFDSSRFDREVVYGEELDLDSLSIEVFTSTGESKGFVPVTESMVVSGNTTTIGDQTLVIEYGEERWTVMYTVFYEIKFTVSHDPTQSSTQLVTEASEIVMPDDPTMSGNTFIGWSEKIPAELTGNMELVAIFNDRISVPKFQATYGDKLSSLELPEVSGGKWQWVDDPNTLVGNATEGRSPNSFQILFVPNNTDLDPIEYTSTISVSKKTLIFSAPTSVEYDPDANKYNFNDMYTLTGFIEGEEEYKPRVILLGDNNVSEIGKYSYTLGVADNNYRGEYVGYFEIKPIEIVIDIVWNSGNDIETIIYGDSLPGYGYTVKKSDGTEYTKFISSDLKVNIHKPVLEVGTHTISASLYDDNASKDGIDSTKYYKVIVHEIQVVVESKVMNPGAPVFEEEYIVRYGDTLGEFKFAYHPNGSWAWVDAPSTLVGNVGTHTFKAQFTPFSSNYTAPAPVDIVIEVLPKQLTFKITSPTTVAYDGNPHNLTYDIIDYETGEKYYIQDLEVSGNDSYIYASDETNTITLTFVDSNYEALENTFGLKITKATPEIESPTVSSTWAKDMYLSSISLDGIKDAKYEGSFRWQNGGTIISVPGTHTYKATFYPKDSSNYKEVTIDITVVLDKATPVFNVNTTEYIRVFKGDAYALAGIIDTSSNSDGTVKFYIEGENGLVEVTSLTDAGVYTVIVVVESSECYKEISKTVKVSIDKANPSITLSVNGWTYGSAANQPDASCADIGNYKVNISGYRYRPVGSDEWIAFTTESYPTDAGKYEVQAYVTEGDNHYAAESEIKTFDIAKQKVNIPAISSMPYTGAVQYPNISSTSLYTVATKGAEGNKGGENVGKYYVTLTLVDSDNYEWSESKDADYNVEYYITKASNAISDFAAGEWTYNGKAQAEHSTTSIFGEVTYTYYLINSEGQRIRVNKSDVINAGTYVVVASVSGTDNYEAAANVEKTFKINKAIVEKPELNNTSFEYDGQLVKPTIVDNNEQNKALYSVYRNLGNTNVGENYEVILTIKASEFSNYRWDGQADDQQTLTLTYSITHAKVNIVSVSQSDWTYLGSSSLPTVEINKTFSVSYKYEYRLKGTEIWSETEPTVAGTYEIRVTVKDDASEFNNYSGGTDNSKIVEFKINPKEISAPSVSISEYVFNNQAQYPVVSPAVSDDYTVTWYKINSDGSETKINSVNSVIAGKYKLVISLNDASYVWSDNNDDTVATDKENKTYEYEIKQATVNVTGVTLNKYNWTFDGTNAIINKISTDKSFGDITFSYTYTFYKKDANGVYQLVPGATKMSDITSAGDYKVVVTLDSAADNANGIKNYIAGTTAYAEFVIDKAQETPSVSLDSNNKIGNPVYKETINSEGTVEKKLSLNYIPNNTFDIQDYLNVTLESTGVESNRNIAKIVITKLNAASVFGLRSATVEGTLSDAGEYMVTYYFESDANYNDETVTVYVSISEKSISGNDISVSHTYNGLIFTGEKLSGEITIKCGDVVLVKDQDYTVSIVNTAGETIVQSADTYTITITGIGNYEGSVTKTFTVEKRSIDINTDIDNTKEYKGEDGYDVSSLINASVAEVENAEFKYYINNVEIDKLTNATTYSVKVVLVHGNYKAEKTVTVTIQKNTTSTGTVNVRDTATYNDLLTSLGDLPTSEYGTWKWLNADKIAVSADATVGNATADDGYNTFYAYFASSDTNYADRYVEIRVKVAKADADLTATANANKSYVEGGHDIASLITVSATYNGNKLNGASFLYYVNGAAESSTKLYGAGTYSIEVVLVHANYKATVATVDVTIDKQKVAVPTVNATAKETYVYTIVDGTAKEHELVLNNFNGLMKYDETKTSVLKATNAGTYYVYVVLNNTDNYEWSEDFDGIIEWKVEKATVLKPNDIKVEYTGSDVITDKLYDTDLYTVSYGTSVIAIGEYKATLTIRPEKFDNYKWNTTDSASVEVIYTIAEKVINWEVSGLDGWEFNTDVDAYTVKATYGESEFEIIKVEFKHEKATEWTEWTENTVPTYAGKYTIRFTSNAHASYTGVTHDVEIEITKATANLPISSLAGKKYDGAAYNTGLTAGSNGIYTISGNVNDAIAKGTYSVTFTLDYVEIGGEKVYNYAWDSSIKTTEDGKVVVNGDTVTLYYSITQATVKVENVTLSDTDNEWTYSGTNGVTINATTDKEFAGVTFTYIYKFYMMDENGEYQLIPDANEMKDIVNAGKYKVVVTVDGNDNYADGSDATKNFVEFEIKQAQETVTFEYIGGTLGTYDAATKTLTLTYRVSGYNVADLIKATLVKSETAALSGRTTTPSITTVGNAGEYTVTYTYAASTNYAVVTDSIKVVINSKVIDLGDLDLDKDYTGNKQTSGFVDNDAYTVDDSGRTEVGEWTVTITLNNPEGVTNYVWSDALKAQASDRVVFNGNILTLTYKITQATVKVTDVTLNKKAWTYDGSIAEITKITIDNTFTNVTFTYTYTFYKLEGETWTKLENVTQMSQIVNAGKYKVVVTVNGNDNYADGSDGTANCAEFTIAQKNIEDKTGDSYDISITHGYDGLTYNGKEFSKTVEVERGNTTLKKDADYTVTITKNGTNGTVTEVKTAGTYTITITGNGNYTGTRTVEFTVGKANASITGTPGSVDATYHPDKSYPANGLFNGVDVEYENYENNVSTGLRPTVTVVYEPFVGATTTTTVEYGQTYEIKNAGTYTITYSFANDNFNKVESVVVTIKIAQATETLGSSFSGTINATYGDDLPTLPKSSNGAWSWENGAIKVGDYTVEGTRTFTAIFTPGEESKNNYKSNTATVTIKVARATATVTGTAASGLEYTGNAFATENNIGTAITGISAEGHSGTFSYSYKHSYVSYEAATESVSEIKNAGYYVVTISFVSDDNNYAGSTTINVYVEKQSVTHTWTNPTYNNGNDLYLTFSNNADKPVIKFLEEGEGITFASTVGDYYANIVLLDTNNYKWADNVPANGEGVVSVNWNIAPCPVDLSNITVSDVVYDGNSHVSNLESKDGYIVTNAGGIDVNDYYITFDLDGANFTWWKTDDLPSGFAYNSQDNTITLKFSITKKNISDVTVGETTTQVVTVTFGSPLGYTGSNQSQSVAVSWMRGETTVSLTETTDFTWTIKDPSGKEVAADAIKNAGTYTVTITAQKDSNYTGSVTRTFTVAKKNISDVTVDETTTQVVTVTFGPTLGYTGSNQSQYISYITWKNGTETVSLGTDDYTWTIKDPSGKEVAANAIKNAGTYIVTITAQGSNYEGSVERTFIVAKKNIENKTENQFDISITHTYNNLKFNNSVLSGSVTVMWGTTTLKKDTDYTVTITKGNENVVKNAGTYTITIEGMGNFEGTRNEVTFTVAKRLASDVIADILRDQDAEYYYEYQIEELFKNGFIVDTDSEGNPLTVFSYVYTGTPKTSDRYYQTAGITVQNLKLDPNVYSSDNYNTTLAGSAGKDFTFYLVAYFAKESTDTSVFGNATYVDSTRVYYASIEKALKDGAGRTVWVMPISAVDANNPITITENCEIQSTTTLILPYGLGAKNDGYKATLVSDEAGTYSSTAQLNRTTLVRIATGVTLTVNGHLEIAGEISAGGGATDYAAHTARDYAELQLGANAKVKVPSTSTSATIKVFGFITEEVQDNGSEVILEAGTLYQPFTVRDYNGGSYMAKFASKENIDSWLVQQAASMFVADIAKKHNLSAFNEFQFINVHSSLTIKYAAKMHAYVSLPAGGEINGAEVKIVGNTTAYTLQLTKSTSYLTAKYNKATGVNDLDIYGGADLNSLGISVPVSAMGYNFTLSIDTKDTFFPISWAYDVSLNPTDKQVKDGEIAQYNFKYRVQLMPGSKLEVAAGAKLTSTSAIYVHNAHIPGGSTSLSVGPHNVITYGEETDTRMSIAYQVEITVEDKDAEGNVTGTHTEKQWRFDLSSRYAAGQFIVNGALEVDTFAGKITSETHGAMVKITNATRYNLARMEVYQDSPVMSKSGWVYATVVNANGVEKRAGVGMTMTYNHGAWISDQIAFVTVTDGGTYDGEAKTENLGAGATQYQLPIDYLNSITPTKSYYRFVRWYIYDSNGNKLYVDDLANHSFDIVDFTVYIYAEWVAKEYGLDYEYKSDTESSLPSELPIVSIGNKFTAETSGIIPSPANGNGWYFLGWYLDENFTTRVTDYRDIPKIDNANGEPQVTTLYAQWTNKPTYVITVVDEKGKLTTINVLGDEFNNSSMPSLKNVESMYLNNRLEQFYIVGWMNNNGELVTSWSQVIVENDFETSFSIIVVWDEKYNVTVSGNNNLSGANYIEVKSNELNGYYTAEEIKELLKINLNTVKKHNDTPSVSMYFKGWQIGNNSIYYDTADRIDSIDFSLIDKGTPINIVAQFTSKVEVVINYGNDHDLVYDLTGDQTNTETIWLIPGKTHNINTNYVSTLKSGDNSYSIGGYYGGFIITGAGNSITGTLDAPVINISSDFTGLANVTVNWHYKYKITYNLSKVSSLVMSTSASITLSVGDNKVVNNASAQTDGYIYVKPGTTVSITVSAKGSWGLRGSMYVSYTCTYDKSATVDGNWITNAGETPSSISRSGTIKANSNLPTKKDVVIANIVVSARQG